MHSLACSWLQHTALHYGRDIIPGSLYSQRGLDASQPGLRFLSFSLLILFLLVLFPFLLFCAFLFFPQVQRWTYR